MLRRGTLGRFGGALRRLLRDRDGFGLIDFALMAPMLSFLMLGGIETGRYVLLNQKLSRVAITTSDLMSRAQVASIQDIDQIFAAAGHSMKPFALGADGIIHITSVTADDNAAAIPRVDWQRSGAGTASHESLVGDDATPGNGPPANLPNNFPPDPDQNIIVVEVFYDYTPFIFDGVIETKTIRHTALHRPRLVPLNDLRP